MKTKEILIAVTVPDSFDLNTLRLVSLVNPTQPVSDANSDYFRIIEPEQSASGEGESAIKELISGVRSINRSRPHIVNVDGDDQPCYWQRKAWIDWVIELADSAQSELATLRAQLDLMMRDDLKFKAAVELELENATLRKRNEELQAELVGKMVDRFLGWKLPQDFGPDCGVSFERQVNMMVDGKIERQKRPYDNGWWPSGTNLFTADQAKAMILHMLGDSAAPSLPNSGGDVADEHI